MRIWVTSKNQENYKRIRAGRGIYTIDTDKEQPMDFHPYVFQDKARKIVYEYVMDHLDKSDERHKTFSEDEVYVVWFSKTLQNWKALVSTTLPDGMYYEVTYNGDKRETYVDVYKKFQNYRVLDEATCAKSYKHMLECEVKGCGTVIHWTDNREDINAEWLRDHGWTPISPDVPESLLSQLRSGWTCGLSHD